MKVNINFYGLELLLINNNFTSQGINMNQPKQHQWIKRAAIVATFSIVIAGCAHVDPNSVTRPSGSTPYSGDKQALLNYGEKLWNDASIGTSGLSCNSCHMANQSYSKTFKQPYPHQVAMAKNTSGLTSIDAEQMVQFCMQQPMKAKILPWDSKELAALTLYVKDVAQPNFIKQN